MENTKNKETAIEIQTSGTDEKISKLGIDLTPEQVAIIKNTVAKNTTNTELAFFLNVCKISGLNPFLKEIWCYKDNKNNVIIFASRDGFYKKAQENKLYMGMRSSEVCQNDDFSLDIPNGIVVHKIDFKTPRGSIIGGYAMAFRKGGEPTIEWADINTYDKKNNAWASHKSEMIKKVAEVHALKKAFGISSLQSEDDFDIREGVAMPLNSIAETVDLLDDKPVKDAEVVDLGNNPEIEQTNSQDLEDDKPAEGKLI
ncbi:hypothetical protein LCGC14_1008850 [marine sediment metagenome]|uniref:Phage recombination protein Bet n=1 Tax=marine sediment metagenome TaxID=412755 RepID=A0A0F9NMA2_9ZZZZ